MNHERRRKEIALNIWAQLDAWAQDGQISQDPRQRGIREFIYLSNLVAIKTQNNLGDYLYVMNTILLRFSSEGNAAVALTVRSDQNRPYILDRESFEIGYTGLNADYNDNDPNQIGNHIWAFVATAASPYGSQWVASAGNYFHEIITSDTRRLAGQDTQGFTSWEDYFASDVAIDLGVGLRQKRYFPSEFGKVFEQAYEKEFLVFKGCPQVGYYLDRGLILHDCNWRKVAQGSYASYARYLEAEWSPLQKPFWD